ncbi:MAG: hypothetical protein AVO39_00945 [delta proteobacterium MLS_D]|jgi:tRNA(adenine34) deaminase|nr:MAG: hypothetical protein AVO39_00945 [delta proteobacterium MLS_D]
MNDDERFMTMALEEARAARDQGEVPVGAVIVRDGTVLARGRNSSIALNDPTAHAEICAIRRAALREGNYRLPGTTLYVTIEPCVMCAGAIIQARISRVVYGAPDPKGGAVRSLYRFFDDGKLNHAADTRGGVLERECGEIMSGFFRRKRV